MGAAGRKSHNQQANECSSNLQCSPHSALLSNPFLFTGWLLLPTPQQQFQNLRSLLISFLTLRKASCLSLRKLRLPSMNSGEGNGTPLQYSCLENPMDRGAWWAEVHWVAKSQTRLSNFTLTFHFHALEKEMATHSSVLAWRIPGTGEPGGLPSMGSHRVGHDWSDLAAAAWTPCSSTYKPILSHPLPPQKKGCYHSCQR